MPVPEKQESFKVVIRFGGGLNTRAQPGDIAEVECQAGQNFSIDLEDQAFRPRPAFDLAGTATNGEAIRGFAQLENVVTDSISTLVQAGGIVYQWDGDSSFTQVGTVNAGAKLRGPKAHNWNIGTPRVLITDLNQASPVLQWDGTTLSEVSFNLANDVYARDLRVIRERVWYANVKSGTTTPHLIAASAVEDYDNLDVSNKGGAAGVGAGDPFYLLAPDLRYINGFDEAFGLVVFSTRRGSMYRLTGTDGTDFAVAALHPGSGASGDEPVAYIGNDFAYGRQGRIETLFATEKLGDVGVDDLTLPIAPDVKEIDGWNIYFLPRNQQVYCFGQNDSTLYVLNKEIIDRETRAVAERRQAPTISPWSAWLTDHAIGFQPSSAMVMRDPRDGLENLFFGGPDGKIYRMVGSGVSDGGTTAIATSRTSKVFRAALSGQVFDVSGYVAYRKTTSATLTLTFEHGGWNIFDRSISVTLSAASDFRHFGDDVYFGGDFYFGAKFETRLTRNKLAPSGASGEIAVKAAVSGVEFVIDHIFLEIRAVG